MTYGALTEGLEKAGFDCQIETSGTHDILCSEATWVTLFAESRYARVD